MNREDKLTLAKFHWEKRPELRKEWNGDQEAYMAYHRAEADGIVEIYGGAGAGLSRYSIPSAELGSQQPQASTTQMIPEWDFQPGGVGHKPPEEDQADDPEARQKWDSDPSLQREFENDFSAFQAYHAAERAGHVRYAPRPHAGGGH